MQTLSTKHLFKNVYRGVLSPLISLPLAWSINFGIYQQSLKIFKSNNIWNICLSGGIAGFGWSVIVTPFDIIKCYSQRYKQTTIQSLIDIKNTIGIKNLYRGFIPTLMRDVPLSSVYFTCLELCRYHIPNYNESTFIYPFITGSLCGTLSWMVSLPGDNIKSTIQTNFADIELQKNNMDNKYIESLNINNNKSILQIYNNILNQNGIKGLFRGSIPVILRCIVVSGTSIVVIENVNKKFFVNQP